MFIIRVINMEKEVKLVKKLKRLLKQVGCPRWLHHFGPKKYEVYQHILVVLLMQICPSLSLRRACNLLKNLGFFVPTYSAVCKFRQRLPFYLWENILRASAGTQHEKAAIDSTGFSRSNPSYHYIKRICLRKAIKRFAKLSALFDIKSKRFIALRVRSRARHDSKDAKYLLKRVHLKRLYGDTAYDAEWLHEYCFDYGIQTMIKPRKNVKRGLYRKKQMKKFSEEEYHQRSLIESGFGSLKRKHGGSVAGRNIKSMKTEVYCKAIAHNLSLRERFSTEPDQKKCF